MGRTAPFTKKGTPLMTQLTMLYTTIVGWFQDRGAEERGASLVEYALLLALIAVVAIGALIVLGNHVSTTLNNVANHV